MMMIFDSGRIKPLTRPSGLGDFGWRGVYVPLVPPSYRRASKLRIRMNGRDYALYGGIVPDVRSVITRYEITSSGVEFRRFDGESAGVIPIGGE